MADGPHLCGCQRSGVIAFALQQPRNTATCATWSKQLENACELLFSCVSVTESPCWASPITYSFYNTFGRPHGEHHQGLSATILAQIAPADCVERASRPSSAEQLTLQRPFGSQRLFFRSAETSSSRNGFLKCLFVLVFKASGRGGGNPGRDLLGEGLAKALGLAPQARTGQHNTTMRKTQDDTFGPTMNRRSRSVPGS